MEDIQQEAWRLADENNIYSLKRNTYMRTDNELKRELTKLYTKVAAMRGYIVELKNPTSTPLSELLVQLNGLITEVLHKIDELETNIEKSQIEEVVIDKSKYIVAEAEEHLGNNGDDCNGCNECGISVNTELRVDALREQQ